jgi:hypothetical protein
MIQSIISYAEEESGQLTIMFISYESHQQIMRHFYKVENQTVIRNPDEIMLTAKLSEGTLLYSWGSASFGKLGNGISRTSHFNTFSDFVREDLGATLETNEQQGLT